MTDFEKQTIFLTVIASEELYEESSQRYDQTAYYRYGYSSGQKRFVEMFGLCDEYEEFKKKWYEEHPKGTVLEIG